MSSSDDLSHVCQLEKHLMRFERAWQRDGDASISAVMESVNSSDRLYVLSELIKIDQEHHWKRGNRKRIEQYLTHYPELQADDPCVIELIVNEVTLGRREGESFSKGEILTRFPAMAEALRGLFQPDEQSTSSATIVNLADSTVNPQRPLAPQAIERLGRYNICEELGRGAFAVVYRAWDPQLKRDVAIKIPRDDFGAMEQLRERMLREAQAAANLKHPGIVPIYEVGNSEGRFYIVSELIEGETLADRMHRERAPLADICSWMIAVSEAAHYAHQCGVVHRDIKPANIIIRKDNTPVLTDFGLARQSNSQASLTQHGDIVGTPAFMAPEQAAGRNRDVDAKSDVYSLGVVLYQLICGQLPFEGSTASVLHKVIYEEPRSPRRVRAEIPIDLDTVCSKAIAKEPQRRYESALELAEDLKRWTKHQPIEARPVSAFGRLKLWCQRQPLLAATIFASTLLLAVVIVFSYSRVVHERNRYRSSLYRSLLSDARSQIQAKDTGWWWNALENVGEAAQLNAAPAKQRELRGLALEIMSNTEPCFRLVREKRLHTGSIQFIEPDPQGRFYVTFDDGLAIRVVSSETDEVLGMVGSGTTIQAAAIHTFGEWLLTFDGTSLRRWNLKLDADLRHAVLVEDRLLSWDYADINVLEFSADGSTLAVGSSSGAVYLTRLDENTDTEWKTLGSNGGNPILSLEWSTDNRILASGALDGTVTIWDTLESKIVQQVNATDSATVLAGADDFWTLAIATDAMFGFSLFNRQRDSLASYPSVHADQVVALSPTEHGWLTASRDGSIAFWNGRQQVAVARGGYASITSAFVSPNKEQVIASYGDGYIRRWEFGTTSYAARFNTSHRAAFAPRANQITFSKGVISVDENSNHQRFLLTASRFSVDEFSAFSVGSRPDAYLGGTVRGELIAWDPLSLKVSHRVKAHSGKLTSIAFDPAGNQFVTAGDDGQFTVRSSKTFEPRLQIVAKLGPLHCVAIDGSLVAASGEYGVGLWRISDRDDTAELFRTSHHLSRSAIAIVTATENAKRIAFSGRNGNIKVADVDNLQRVRKLAGHRGEVTALLAVSDNEILSAGNDMTLRLWRIGTGAEVRRWQTRYFSTWIAANKSRELLATGGTFPTSFFNQSRSTEIASIAEHCLCFGAFDQERDRYVGATSEGYLHYIASDSLPLLSNERTDQSSESLTTYKTLLLDGGHQHTVWENVFSPDGSWLATGSHDQTVKIWNAQSLELVHTLRGHQDLVWSAAFSPDSRFLATGSAQEVQSDAHLQSTGNASDVVGPEPEPESLSGDIRIWNVASGEPVMKIAGHDHLVRGLAYHPNGRWLISCSTDRTIQAWDVSSGNSLGIIASFDQMIHDVAFSSDGKRIAAACHESQVALIDVEELTKDNPQLANIPPPTFLENEHSRVWAVAFSPDDELLVSGSDAGEFTFWSVRTLQSLATIRTNATRARSLSFSGDGDWLVSGNYENSQSILWNLRAIKTKLANVGLDW